MVDKESMAGDGLWQNCNNTDGWVQDYREDEGSTLYLLRRSNEIRFLWMLHDRFDRWGLGIASHHHLPQTGKIQEEDGGVLHWFLEILKIIYPTTPNRKFLEFSFLSEDQKFSSLNVLNLRHEEKTE